MNIRRHIFVLAALSALQAFSLSAFSQTAPGQDAIEKLQQKIAQKPKSDKWNFSLLPVGMQKNPQVDFTIVTEMTDDGRKLPKPDAGKPVYYISHSMGEHDVGDAYGGTKEITYEFLRKQLDGALSSNGYRPADQDHPPTQVLFFVWGMHNTMSTAENMDTGDTETDDDSGDDIGGTGDYSTDSDDIMNLLSRAKTIGGQKFAEEFAQALSDQLDYTGDDDPNAAGPLRRFKERDDTTDTLVTEIFGECYYLIVTSMDLESLKQNVKKPLWTTHISTDSQGVSFQQTLPIMINNGAYYFGRETDGAEIVRKRAYKNATVSLGDISVVDYETGTSGTAAPATTGTAAPAATPPSTSTTGTTPEIKN